MPTECQFQANQVDVHMQELQPKSLKEMQQHPSGPAVKLSTQQMNRSSSWQRIVWPTLTSWKKRCHMSVTLPRTLIGCGSTCLHCPESLARSKCCLCTILWTVFCQGMNRHTCSQPEFSLVPFHNSLAFSSLPVKASSNAVN